jgi:hydroxypyruvate isomerase
MPQLDVLIDLFFKDQPWDRRVAQIADCGYRHVETWQGGDAAVLKQMADAGKACGVTLVSMVMNSMTDARTVPIASDNRQRFLDQMDRYSDNALAAGCQQGIVTAGQSIGGKSYPEQRRALVAALRAAGERAAKKGFRLNLEPLNTEVDHPGYFLASREDSAAIVREVGLDSVRMLYDVYHMDIMAGNQTVFIEANIDCIGHFHSAGIPGRHELFEGETHYPFLLKRIEQAGYKGYFGLEYFPLLESRESLARTLDYLAKRD